MSTEIIDVPATPADVEPTPAPANSQAEQLQAYINNELRFAEETIIRALRSAVVNVVNALQPKQ